MLNNMKGIVLINKQSGNTSHDVVYKARKILKIKKVGHAGTLDPLATGLLILMLGKSTKLFDKFLTFDKAYRATLILGLKTTSADTEGETIEEKPCEHITKEDIEQAVKKFIGDIKQVPPMVSAIKYKGKKLYELARKGIEVVRKPRDITIHKLEIESIEFPKVKLYIECSKGTYIRQLAEDIGEELGCGACICQIERTKIGDFKLKDAILIEDLNESHIRDWQG